MAVEIERKFLVDHKKWKAAEKGPGELYEQGYLIKEKSKTIRIRVTEKSAFITIKGETKGASRTEFEYLIPIPDARELLRNFCSDTIRKTRYKIEYQSKIWEVDEFSGSNEGLILAEIELSSEDEFFEKPDWIAMEVTQDPGYYNSNLLSNPYTSWKDQL